MTEAPCIESNAASMPNPVPTTVTVVPTEAEAGFTIVMDDAITVNGTELKVMPAAIVWRPVAAAPTVKSTVFVLTSGHAWAAGNGPLVTALPSKVIAAGAVVPKYVTVTVEPLAPDEGEVAMMFPEVVIVTIVEIELVPSLMVIEY